MRGLTSLLCPAACLRVCSGGEEELLGGYDNQPTSPGYMVLRSCCTVLAFCRIGPIWYLLMFEDVFNHSSVKSNTWPLDSCSPQLPMIFRA